MEREKEREREREEKGVREILMKTSCCYARIVKVWSIGFFSQLRSSLFLSGQNIISWRSIVGRKSRNYFKNLLPKGLLPICCDSKHLPTLVSLVTDLLLIVNTFYIRENVENMCVRKCFTPTTATALHISLFIHGNKIKAIWCLYRAVFCQLYEYMNIYM